METTIYEKVNYLNQLSVDYVLNYYGFEKARRYRGKYYCKWHNDTGIPNLSINRRGNYCNCFACNRGGNPLTVMIREEKGPDTTVLHGSEFYDTVCELYEKFSGIISAAPIYKPEPEPEVELDISFEDIAGYMSNLSQISLQYLSVRGIYTPSKFYLGEFYLYGTPYITIPVIFNEEIVLVKGRRNDLVSKNENSLRYYTFPGSKTFYPHKLFNDDDKRIFFVEDSFSAMSINDMGFPVVSLASGNCIQERGKPLFKEILQDKEVIIIPDRDKAGDKLVKDIENLGISIENVQHCTNGFKDFSDFYSFNRGFALGFILELWYG